MSPDRKTPDRKAPDRKRPDERRDEPTTRFRRWRRALNARFEGATGALDVPLDANRRGRRTGPVDTERFGRASERFARFMGTASFLVGMTVFVVGWLAWNWLAPESLQFDPRRLNFTLMTLLLSLQASYAAPLILLAQNRQADRDRVSAEQDRDRAERALADTEYLAREVAALRIALGEVATRDFVRSELRALLDEYRQIATDGGERTRAKKKQPAARTAKSPKDIRDAPAGSSGSVPATVRNGFHLEPHRSGSTEDATVPTESS